MVDAFLSRRTFMAAAAGLAACGGLIAGLSIGPVGVQANETHVYTGIVDGVALGGHDAVAYFTDGVPVEGTVAHSFTWQGAQWFFATAENRDRFVADPAAYAPQYGGYCAWAVAQGYTAHGDPHVWAIVDGRLYLNYSSGIQRRWERDVPGHISRADINWPEVLSK